MGHAIVAPDCPNIREIVEHDSDAILFDPADPIAFGQAVARLAADPELREKLGAAAAATITRNERTWADNARRIASLAERALEGARPIRQAAIS
jgi:glycosyltransferase involved in cell wall biosynthesis